MTRSTQLAPQTGRAVGKLLGFGILFMADIGLRKNLPFVFAAVNAGDNLPAPIATVDASDDSPVG